jgi:hypothetical protein
VIIDYSGELNYEPPHGNCPANWTAVPDASPTWLIIFLVLITCKHTFEIYLTNRQRILLENTTEVPKIIKDRLPEKGKKGLVERAEKIYPIRAYEMKASMIHLTYVYVFWMLIWSFRVPAKIWHWTYTIEWLCVAQNCDDPKNVGLLNNILGMLMFIGVFMLMNTIKDLPVEIYNKYFSMLA